MDAQQNKKRMKPILERITEIVIVLLIAWALFYALAWIENEMLWGYFNFKKSM